MRHYLVTILLLSVLGSTACYGEDFSYVHDGQTLYFNILSSTNNTVELTHKNFAFYSGNVTIPELVANESTIYTVVSIGDGAFYDCEDLTGVTIPNSVKTISDRAFYNCSSLESIDIPSSVTLIGDSAFSGTGLISVDIPESVTSIGSDAFAYSMLMSVKIPESVTSIASGTFLNTQLEEVQIPESVTSIGIAAFQQTPLVEIEIPGSVTTIGSQAFYICRNLEYLVIPESVVSIGTSAFYECNLMDVIVKNPDPDKIKIGALVFFYAENDICNLYVPAGSKDLYANAPEWNVFKNIIEQIPERTVNINDGNSYTRKNGSSHTNVTYTRTFDNTNWQSVYLPFDMSYDEWSPYADIAELYNVSGSDVDGDGAVDNVRIEFNRLKEGSSIRPNIPYLIKAKEEGTFRFECKDKVLLAAPSEDGSVECSSTKATYGFHGIYQAKTDVYQTGVYLLSDGNFIQAADESVVLAPNRAYLTITPKTDGYNDPDNMSYAPMRIVLVVDGEEENAGIDDVIIASPHDDIYYDLTGRKVINPTSGIYIYNGHKTYIK